MSFDLITNDLLYHEALLSVKRCKCILSVTKFC
uniref:Uncharacterized protein n=1 Tax=Rhizophora mucronata TaxID=61149 RepID=A0A2P2PGW7_RHIMU